ncbi:AraC family transcriptional regulator [Maritalea sp.]|jgi:AraC-like DNA-binding protein|uniref:AraC family transcriptional regulator n=1 Tax=Maritalea sp. TaxID=2003361 RepID=UPI0039E2BA12
MCEDSAWLNEQIVHEPLAKHRLFRSGDLDCAREMVARKYCAHKLDIAPGDTDLDVVHNHFATGDLSFNYMRYGGKVEINPGELNEFYLIQIPLRGGAQVRNGNQTVDSTVEFATILNPDLKTEMVWHADCEMLLVQIDANRVNQEAEKFLGRNLLAPVRFEPTIRMKAKQLSEWRHQLRSMFRDAEHGQMPIGSTEMILQLLEAAPSNVQCFFDVAPSGIAPNQIKRAMDYIKSSFRQDLTLDEIARAAGASPRALQYGFKDNYGMTPMQMLRLERLRWARHLLLTAYRQQTVTQIALDLGFQHLGRFAQEYREAFGETPNQTLQNSKQQSG